MSSIVISGDTSGTVTVTVPAVAGTNTVTIPAVTGTAMVSGNMPAFSAYLNATQTFTSTVATKVLFDTEEFDTNNNFASSRFTPTVAGYYQINASVYLQNGGLSTYLYSAIYKNGAEIVRGVQLNGVATTTLCSVNSAIVYLNGSTDYVEIYGNQSATTPAFGGGLITKFSGSLVRSA